MRNPTEPQATAEKRPYTTPVLVEYGSVQDLTAGGSGTTNELNVETPADCKVAALSRIAPPFC